MITAKDLELHAKWLTGESDGKRLERGGANLEDAYLTGVNLAGAYLADANLAGANLTDAYLRGANLTGAYLRGANLAGANLRGANLADANLRDANLADANLADANLRDANLADANLAGATGLPIAADAADRLKDVATAALQPDALNMSKWHTCGTTHCIAGWAIHLAGEPGRLMESMMGAEVAGLLLLGTEAHQHFHDTNEKALGYLRGVVANG